MTKPIKPNEVAAAKANALPDKVIEAFNELIAKHFHNGSTTVKQKDVAALIAQKMGVPESEVYANNWLDVEPVYREAGWSVEYDKPGYNESYDACFVFKEPRR